MEKLLSIGVFLLCNLIEYLFVGMGYYSSCFNGLVVSIYIVIGFLFLRLYLLLGDMSYFGISGIFIKFKLCF